MHMLMEHGESLLPFSKWKMAKKGIRFQKKKKDWDKKLWGFYLSHPTLHSMSFLQGLAGMTFHHLLSLLYLVNIPGYTNVKHTLSLAFTFRGFYLTVFLCDQWPDKATGIFFLMRCSNNALNSALHITVSRWHFRSKRKVSVSSIFSKVPMILLALTRAKQK